MASLEDLTTPHLADACMRLAVPVRCAPSAVRAAVPGLRVSGRVRPVQHVGSVDVFLEAFESAAPGDVLVVDNGGRLDEACVGDLVTLEAKMAGLAGIVIWGLHRDTVDLGAIALPVFSIGTLPSGPQRLDTRPADTFERARVGEHTVTSGDYIAADADGVIFLPGSRIDDIRQEAAMIRDTERRQARLMAGGRSLREQLQFREYLERRRRDPNWGFRQHLRELKASIEE
jgi:regulator of RNase E activity RraA